jgi:hypothetical protein
MPHTDYNDVENQFPRLEARIQQIEPDAYHLKIWLWQRPGERREIFNGKRAGSFHDAHEILQEQAEKHNAVWEADDVIVGAWPEEDTVS